MNQISAKLICYSTNHLETPIATIQLHIPKWLIQEVNTHRVFSRSFSSFRAIPAKVVRKSASFEPKEWLSNQPGMTGGKELEGIKKLLAIAIWRTTAAIVKVGHRLLEWCGVHKQYTNRWLEPIAWADGVVTSTEWSNFLKLRNHPDAQPEIRELARQIEHLLADNEPDFLEPGEWHLPYIDADAEDFEYDWGRQCLISMGRCARVSYGLQSASDPEADIARARRLLDSVPMHISPAEHQAQCPWGDAPSKSGNFQNWKQLRQDLEC